MPILRRNSSIARGNLGFTLIELMIVVAVIGILSKLAISNHDTNQARARQAESKLSLTTQYSLEKAFFSEYGAYIGSFDAIGYSPEGFKRYYATGWAVCQNAGTITGFNGTIGVCWYGRLNAPAAWNTTPYGGGNYNQASFGGNNPQPTDVDSQLFLLYTRGQIRDEQTIADGWRIDQNRRLINDTNGL